MSSYILNSFYKNEFFFENQPIVDTRSNDVVYVEALIRQKVDGEVRSPAHFINELEESFIKSEQSFEINDKLIELMAQYVHFIKQDVPGKRISFNFTAAQLCNDAVRKLIHHHLNYPGVIIELVERDVLEYIPSLGGALQELQQAGFLIALDDLEKKTLQLLSRTICDYDFIKIDRREALAHPEVLEKACFHAGIINTEFPDKTKIIIEFISTPEDQAMFIKKNLWIHQGFLYKNL